VPVNLALLALAPLTLLLRRRSVRRFHGSVRLMTLLLVLFGCSTMFTGCGSGLQGTTPGGTYAVTVTAVSTYTGFVPATTAAFAPGCVVTPAGSTSLTCTQTATVNLTVQ
jgi:hypothetical protein